MRCSATTTFDCILRLLAASCRSSLDTLQGGGGCFVGSCVFVRRTVLRCGSSRQPVPPLGLSRDSVQQAALHPVAFLVVTVTSLRILRLPAASCRSSLNALFRDDHLQLHPASPGSKLPFLVEYTIRWLLPLVPRGHSAQRTACRGLAGLGAGPLVVMRTL
jgi:hypothetical protein